MSTQTATDDGRSVRAQEKRARRRKTILDAALRVFSDKGYHQTRIADIIEEASIARGTFYLYFDSKTAIFHELLEDVLRRIGESVAGVDLEPGALPVREQLLNVVRRIFAFFRSDRALAKLILREAVGLDEEVDAMLDGFYGRLHDWLRESLANGQRIGLIRDIDTDLTSWLILGSVKQFAALVLARADDEIDLDRMAEVILDFNLQGIRAF
ncbi:MAG: TetR/AcrR family transcriptional regulator [Myxococcales bacterium]|nr:TetR/AcrR family transcriptional regulator [Myxococcales bacterium]